MKAVVLLCCGSWNAAKCLLCGRVLSNRRKCVLERHCNTLHKEEYDALMGDERQCKLEELNSRIDPYVKQVFTYLFT
jgi:hypothetical protein